MELGLVCGGWISIVWVIYSVQKLCLLLFCDRDVLNNYLL